MNTNRPGIAARPILIYGDCSLPACGVVLQTTDTPFSDFVAQALSPAPGSAAADLSPVYAAETRGFYSDEPDWSYFRRPYLDLAEGH